MSGQSQPKNLTVTAWYLNIHRIVERIGTDNLPDDFLSALEQVKAHPLSKGLTVSLLSSILIAWVQHQKIPALESLLLTGTLQRGSIFTYDGKLISSGLATGVEGDAALRLSLKEFGDERNLVIRFHTDGLTTSSARGALQRQPSVFVVAYVDSISELEVNCRPYVIGDLLQQVGETGICLRYRNSLKLSLDDFDALRNVDFGRRVEESNLASLKNISEKKVKKAFAKVFGEPLVPKDWGGEECDLYSSNVMISGRKVDVAFAFKGPSKFKPMECSDCGKNGDQIVRLFGTEAEVCVLQHCHKVQSNVRKSMAAFARGSLGVRRRFAIVDGYDTWRILKHFQFLK